MDQLWSTRAARAFQMRPTRRVVTILEFNPTQEFLKNAADVIVEWDIQEKATSQIQQTAQPFSGCEVPGVAQP
eukprot:3602731-Rhodomonas_salina.1